MITTIGTFSLTSSQVANMSDLTITPFKCLTIDGSGQVEAESEDTPTQGQIDALVALIEALPTQISDIQAANRFNVLKCKQDLYIAFAANLTLLTTWAGLIGNMAEAKSFAQLKALAASVLTGQDLTDFKGVFLAQDINLDNY